MMQSLQNLTKTIIPTGTTVFADTTASKEAAIAAAAKAAAIASKEAAVKILKNQTRLTPDDIKLKDTIEKNETINKFKSLENFSSDNKILFMIYNNVITSSINANTFSNLSYLFYKPNINYIGKNFENKPNIGENIINNDKYGIKILAYLTIDIDQTYKLTPRFVGGHIKIYLNNFLILDDNTGEKELNIYLKKGTYVLYIERLHIKNNLIKHAGTNKCLDSGPGATEPLYFKPCDTNNTFQYWESNNNTIKHKSSNQCIQNIGIDIYKAPCVNDKTKQNWEYTDNNNVILTQNPKCMDSDGNKLYYFGEGCPQDNPYKQFISSTDFHLYLTPEKETGLKSINSYIKIPYTLFNNIIKNRNNSITNYCKDSVLVQPDTICSDNLKNNDLLSKNLIDYCIPNGNILKDDTKKFHKDCRKYILNKELLNNSTGIELVNGYLNWYKKTINDLSANITKTSENYPILEENYEALGEEKMLIEPSYFKVFENNPNKLPTQQLISLCEKKIGDKFSADVNSNTLCDRLYSAPNIDLSNVNQSKDKIKKNYCLKDNRYENDTNCKPLYTSLLSDDIKNRCIKNNEYQNNDQFCNTISNQNILDNVNEPYKSINESRVNLLKNEISKINPSNKLEGKILSENSFNFAMNKYKEYPNKKLSEELLNQKLLDYCEVNEPNYPTNEISQCKDIYTAYKNENNIKDSRNKMRDSLCIDTKNLLTDNNDDSKSNIYNCKSTVFNTKDNLNKFVDTVNSYCSTGSNITSTECKDYYNDIESKILDNLNLTIKPIQPFSNKNEDIDYNQYDNVVLESFNNDNPDNNATNESTLEDNNLTNDMIMDTPNNEYMIYLLLLVIFAFLIGVLLYSCSIKCNTSNNSNTNNTPNIITPIKKK